MQGLAGKVAVVTGGASGIGSGMVDAFAEAGMHVVVADIELDAARAVAEGARGRGVDALAVRTDVTDVESVHALAERAYDELGAVHVLCNNAGVLVFGKVAELRIEDWRWVYGVNVFGVINGLHEFVPRMLAQGGEGHIVNTASVVAFTRGPGREPYTSSKAAVVAITEDLRSEVAGAGIGVTALVPGGVSTRIGESQRNRASEFGPAAVRPPREAGAPESSSPVLDPIDVGRMVRHAIERNDPWVFTHPEWLAANLDHAQGVLDTIREWPGGNGPVQ
jgi:NAD(P)-dependent dehydrogenase (short-subunit alcohol dehydrogenase family)